ncbi:MAG: PD-(D/E)XK nuclease family protein [Bdellovibrionales bacterium]|nr:PD-(D/E)XK nuclease family protein [Bdellovibrionales bacterium]
MNLDPSWFSGLTPSVILIVGAGYQREQIKDSIMEQVGAVAGKWIFTPDQLAREIVMSEMGDLGLVSSLGRQEYFRLIFSNRKLLARFPSLKKLKRRESFFARLDRAVQSCREVASHSAEREFLEGRLAQLNLGDPELRREIQHLAGTFEAWLESENIADSTRYYQCAIEILDRYSVAGGFPKILQGRRQALRYTIQDASSLESLFFTKLGAFIEVSDGSSLLLSVSQEELAERRVSWNWKRSHTLQDSVERLVSELRSQDYSKHVVLIPDSPSDARMVLRRALKEAGILEMDPRDPHELRLTEIYKTLFLPLDCVLSHWDAQKTLALLKSFFSSKLDRKQLAAIQKKVMALGQRPGLKGFLRITQGLIPDELVVELEGLDQSFQGRMNFRSLKSNHLEWCARLIRDSRIMSWLSDFWVQFESDLSRIQLLEQRYPLAIWLDRIRGRVDLTGAPISSLRPARGIRIVRMSQANAASSGYRLWILGCPAAWLSPPSESDLFLGSREREVLSLEFQLRSSSGVSQSRKRALLSWLSNAASVEVLDHAFELDGSETESLEGLLLELGAPKDLKPVEVGAHERFLESYGLVRKAVGDSVHLAGIASGSSFKISATTLDLMSKCSYLGMLSGRWRISELEEPDWELWPRVRGVLLHRAVEQIVRCWEEIASAAETTERVSSIWKSVWTSALSRGDVPGWIQSPQLERQIHRKAVEVLLQFVEAEREYRSRSGVRCLVTEDDAKLELSWTDRLGRQVLVSGKADRIDEHEKGLFVLDYKTGTQSFKGGDIREKGYRLQLPFYALGAKGRFKRPVLGVQLIELTKDARRSVGLFPRPLNGKMSGCLTQLGKTNSGLFDEDPDELWSTLQDKIHQVVEQYADGHFEARPTIGSSECLNCRAHLICGQARRDWVLDSIAGDAADGTSDE